MSTPNSERNIRQSVFIVDDDPAILDALGMLIESVGLCVHKSASAIEFLESYDDSPGVLLLDVRMPGMSGLELQAELVQRNFNDLAVIFMSGHGDIPMAVEALKNGATDFLEKPFRDQDLLDRVHAVLELNKERLEESVEVNQILARIEALTPRERQVMKMVADGLANKVVALDLGISQRTVELHRSHIMQKMEVRSLAHLVRTLAKVNFEQTN